MGSAENNFNISREFLANALGLKFDILEYKVNIGSKPGDNFASVIYSADVKAKNKIGETVTKSLLLKCYPVHPTRQEFTNRSNIFFKEMEIYRLWIPELKRFQTEIVGLIEAIKLPYAPFIYGKSIDFSSAKENEYEGVTIDPLDNCIIMEDLRKSGFRMTNRRKSMDIDHIRLVVLELAKIHSLSWAFKSHVEKDVSKKYPCLAGNFMANDRELWVSTAYKGLDQAISTLESIKGADDELPKAMTGFKDVVGSVLDVFSGVNEDETLDSLLRVKHDQRFGKDASNPEPWRVISHGDCWSNNMLFKYDEKTGKPVEIVLIDLQLSREACLMPDLAYAIYACTDTELRKDHLEDLMKLYVDTFNGFCKTLKTETLPGFNLESFKYRFHRFKLIGLMMASLCFPIMLKEEDKVCDLDMEDMDHNKEVEEMFSTFYGTSGNNQVYNDRLLGLVQEMYEDGVI